MDTKWRKSRIIISFAAFFLGMSLLIGNFVSMLSMVAASDWKNLGKNIGTDYQETEEFSWFISNRLEALLGVATGGRCCQYYGVAYEEDYQMLYDGSYGWSGSYTTETVENVAVDVEEGYAGEAVQEESIEPDDYEWDAEEYMEDLARDKNVRYAVIYQGKLLYTNIEEIEPKLGENIGASAPATYTNEEEYNFSLWFNLNGDGKVEITKDGKALDIYGDGVYTEDSRWYVPGYTNFNTDESAMDAVIYLAVAKNPKLYISGNYSEYGTTQYGGRLYYMQKSQLAFRERFQACCVRLIAALLLLILAFVLRKDKRLADRAIAGFLGKIWLELKILLFLLIPVVMLLTVERTFLRELIWLGTDILYLYKEELAYYAGSLVLNGTLLTVCFWLIYLAAIDLHFNKGKQKKLVGGLLESLRARDLKLPVQKRLVKRQRFIFAACLASGVCLLVLMLVLWDSIYWNTIYWEPVDVALISVIILFCILLLAGSVLWCSKKNRRLAEDIGTLSDQIEQVREGDFSESQELLEDTDLKAASENLSEIRQGMEKALKEQTQSERMKVELIANVSHDIKTPLTSIISYVELLKQEEDLPAHVREYIQILGEKSGRLKTMVQDVFEVSKAASGQLPVKMEDLDLGKLLRQTLADMNVQIEQSGLAMKISIPEAPVMIRADGQRLYRVFQNLIQNALQYSLKGSRIYLTLTEAGQTAIASIKNTSGTELDSAVDFTERFVRGDESRTDGGSGLGLSIARSFTEACGGQFQVETNADLFTVTVIFSKRA